MEDAGCSYPLQRPDSHREETLSVLSSREGSSAVYLAPVVSNCPEIPRRGASERQNGAKVSWTTVIVIRLSWPFTIKSPSPLPHDSGEFEELRRMRGKCGGNARRRAARLGPHHHTHTHPYPPSHTGPSRETLRRRVVGRAEFPSFHGAPRAELCALKIGSHTNRRAGGGFGRLLVPPPPGGYRATLSDPELPSPDMEF